MLALHHRQVLALVPMAPTRLLPVLAAGLPHKSRDRDAHCLALRGVFALAASPAGATIREGLLAAVVDDLLELDVEIRWQVRCIHQKQHSPKGVKP